MQRVDTIAELFDLAAFYTTNRCPAQSRGDHHQRRRPGHHGHRRGGPQWPETGRVERTDAAEAPPSLPAAASVRNPVDVIGDARADRYEVAIRTVLEDESVDMGLVILTPQSTTDPEGTAKILPEAIKGLNKPVVCSFMGQPATWLPAWRSFVRRGFRITPAGKRRSCPGRRRPVGEPPRDLPPEIRQFSDIDVSKANKLIQAAAGGQKERYLTQAECRPIFECYRLPLLKAPGATPTMRRRLPSSSAARW